MALDTLSVAPCQLSPSWPVIASDCDEPIVTWGVVLADDGCGNGEIAVGVEQGAGVPNSMAVIAEVDLGEPDVHTRGRKLS
jgi:hypothetical protein